MQIIVLENERDLARLAETFRKASEQGRKVRVAIEGGFKLDGPDTAGWSPPLGRPADETGH